MKITIVQARMEEQPDGALSGSVQFLAEGDETPYELFLRNEKGKVWDYSLHFTSESGNHDQITAVSDRIDEDDELFDQLLDAALETLDNE